MHEENNEKILIKIVTISIANCTKLVGKIGFKIAKQVIGTCIFMVTPSILPFIKLFLIRHLLNDGNMFFVISLFSLSCSRTDSILIIVHRE